jgi:type IV fimbrial biogenesis protein FimT
VELCVVVALIAILAAVAAPSMRDIVDRHRLESAASQLATDVQFTRTEAVARNENLRISVHALSDGSCYVIHTGAANQCDCQSAATTVPATCSGGAQEIKTVRLMGAQGITLQGVASMQFVPVHGTVTPTGTLHVQGPKGRAIDHVVNVMGKLRSCSPGSTVPGYKVCSS